MWRKCNLFALLVGMQNGAATVERRMEILQKNFKWIYLLTQQSHFWEFIQRNRPKKLIQKNISSPMFIAALFTIAKIWKQPECPSVDEQIKKRWYIYTMEYFLAVKKKEIFNTFVIETRQHINFASYLKSFLWNIKHQHFCTHNFLSISGLNIFYKL